MGDEDPLDRDATDEGGSGTGDDKGSETEVAKWLRRVEKQRGKKDWQDWADTARRAIATYEGKESVTIGGTPHQIRGANLFHSSVETVVPAIYNSTPVVDCRPMFGEGSDAERIACQMMEQAGSYDIAEQPFDANMVDLVLATYVTGKAHARKRYTAEYAPPQDDEDEDETADEDDDRAKADSEPEDDSDGDEQEMSSDRVWDEIVHWDRCTFGPARDWQSCPWVAFDLDLTAEEIDKLSPGASKRLSFAEKANDIGDGDQAGMRLRGQGGAADDKGITGTTRVIEIWDKPKKRILFLAWGDRKKPIAVKPDPFELAGFFPMPRPMIPMHKIGTMIPVTAWGVHHDLLDEYESVSRRLKGLVTQLRVRGLVDAELAVDLEQLASAKDGQYIKANNSSKFGGQQGGLSSGILHMPLEQYANVIDKLSQRKAAIEDEYYKASGIADLLRGAGKASATATAENIKSQWANLRINRLQGEAERYARDLIRMGIQIRCKLTPWERWTQISGIDFIEEAQDLTEQMASDAPPAPPPPPQQQPAPSPMMGHNGGPPMGPPPDGSMPMTPSAGPQGDPSQPIPGGGLPGPGMPPPQGIPGPPSAPPAQAPIDPKALEDAVQAVIRDPNQSIKIDIETGSTTRADMGREQEQINNFVGMTAQYMQAMVPVVQMTPEFKAPLMEMWTKIAQRSVKLGKSFDDVMTRLVEIAEEHAHDLPADQQQGPAGPSPEQMQHEKDMAGLENQKAQTDQQTNMMQAEAKQRVADTQAQTTQAKVQIAGISAQNTQTKANTEIQKAQIDQNVAQLNAAAKQMQPSPAPDLATSGMPGRHPRQGII